MSCLNKSHRYVYIFTIVMFSLILRSGNASISCTDLFTKTKIKTISCLKNKDSNYNRKLFYRQAVPGQTGFSQKTFILNNLNNLKYKFARKNYE